MYELAALLFRAEAQTRMGRPPSSDLPEERAKHLEVLRAQLAGMSIRETARKLECSRRTVAYYRKRARAYPEADTIIRLASVN